MAVQESVHGPTDSIESNEICHGFHADLFRGGQLSSGQLRTPVLSAGSRFYQRSRVHYRLCHYPVPAARRERRHQTKSDLRARFNRAARLLLYHCNRWPALLFREHQLLVFISDPRAAARRGVPVSKI